MPVFPTPYRFLAAVRLQRHGAALVIDHMLELATAIAKLT
jgi:hypothetical protein